MDAANFLIRMCILVLVFPVPSHPISTMTIFSKKGMHSGHLDNLLAEERAASAKVGLPSVPVFTQP